MSIAITAPIQSFRIFHTNSFSLIQFILYFFCFCYLVLILSYVYGWKKTRAFRSGHLVFHTKVSIILPVRNEEKNILTILQHLSKQDYPKDKFEVIVVDDFSTDNTFGLAQKGTIPIKYIHLQNDGGKKKAIAEGISQASGNLIVTTDADCEMQENWLSTIVAFYEKNKPKMIVAPVLLKSEDGFKQIIQSQEMMVLTASAAAALYYNFPIFCSGANLIYEKEAFIAVNGFEGVDKTMTGDDVFLMLKIHNRFPKGIKYLKSRNAVIYTNAEKSILAALAQRKRWASKSFSYGFSYVTCIAMLVFFANFLILVSGIMSAINIKFVPVLIISFSVKCLIDCMLLSSSSLFFGKKIHPIVFIMASIVYPVYVSAIGIIAPFTNYSWRGRKPL